MFFKKLIGEVLFEKGIITEQNLKKALQMQTTIFDETDIQDHFPRTSVVSNSRSSQPDTAPMLGKILLDMGFAAKEQLELALKEQEEMVETYRNIDSDKLFFVIERCSIINSSLSIAEVLQRIMKYANAITGSEASTLMLLDDKTGELVFSVPTGPKADKLMDIRLAPGKGIAGWVVKNDKHILIHDVKKDSRFCGEIDNISGFETKSILCVALKAKSKVIGALEVINKADGVPFTDEDTMLLEIFANQAAMAIENARLHSKLQNKLEEEKQFQRKLVEAERLRALGLMASGIAHDFNNMLTIILGNAEMLVIDEDRNSISKRVKMIKQAAIDSANIIKRLQKFTKSTEGDNQQFKPVKINDIVRDSITLTKPMWKDTPQENGITIEIVTHLTGKDLIMLGNDSDLREMMINLIFNSVDAMPQGGTINITTLKKEDNMVLEISDTGVGMSDETIVKLFDPFFTTKGVKHCGLGMSMISGIIKRHAGKIEVNSKLTKGTTFTISFPSQNEITENESDTAIAKIKNANILIIDDNSAVRNMLANILVNQGHRTDVFGNGADGIEAFRNGDYTILISDLGMPDVSGWDVIRMAKQIKPSAVFGLITGWDITADKAKQEGVDFIIYKPFEVIDVVKAIANAVKSKNDLLL
ncbi:MAG: ATP-binding protein [Candidatus Anammoxibacter sp.]